MTGTRRKEPIQKRRMVEVLHWDCGHQKHHHLTKETAQNCIDRWNERKTTAPRAMIRRNAEILKRYAAGRESVSRLGREFQLHRSRITQIVKEYLDSTNDQPTWRAVQKRLSVDEVQAIVDRWESRV